MDAEENEANVVEDVIDDDEEEDDDEKEEDVEEEEEDGPLDWQGEASEIEQDDADTEASAKKSKNKSTFAELFEEFDHTIALFARPTSLVSDPKRPYRLALQELNRQLEQLRLTLSIRGSWVQARLTIVQVWYLSKTQRAQPDLYPTFPKTNT
eukprot:Nk52_evm8s251 gene=Nk52_evmTU8s251